MTAVSALAICGLAGCSEKEQVSGENTLQVTPDKVTFAARNNEDVVITVKTDAEEWNYSADGWIDAEKDGDNLIVNVPNNMEYEERTGKILFTAGTARSVRVDVVQEARVQSSLELTQETVEAGPQGGQFEITVTSAEEWRVQGSSEWCTLSPSEGVSGDKISVNVSANEGEQVRTAVFNVISGTVTRTLTVISNPVPFIELVSPESGTQSFDYNGGDFTVLLRTNLDASQIKHSVAGNDGGGWVSVQNAGETAYSVHISSNNSFVTRQATVTFSAGDEIEPVSVTVVQAKRPYLKVTEPADQTYELGLEGDRINVTISTNLNVAVSAPDWITQEGEPQVSGVADGLTDYTYAFNVSAASGSRSGQITFSYEQSSASVTVRQVSSDLTYVTVPDPVFREFLMDNGYIMENSGETVALTAEGVSAASFDFSFGYTDIASLEGIEAFKSLESIDISDCQGLTRVDISALTKVSSLNVGTAGYISDLILGDNPIAMLYYGWETTVYANPVTISGTGIKALVVSATGWGAMPDSWYELDVTGCPNLVQIDSQRKNELTIYVTAEQMEKIYNTGNGVLTVR